MTQLQRLGIEYDVQQGWSWEVKGRKLSVDKGMVDYLVDADNDPVRKPRRPPARRTDTGLCPACNGAVIGGRKRIICSDRCRKRMQRMRAKQEAQQLWLPGLLNVDVSIRALQGATPLL